MEDLPLLSMWTRISSTVTFAAIAYALSAHGVATVFRDICTVAENKMVYRDFLSEKPCPINYSDLFCGP